MTQKLQLWYSRTVEKDNFFRGGNMKRSLRITISGNVQDMSFKEKIQHAAEKFKLEGICENLDEDKLIILVNGESEMLDNLIDTIYEGTLKTKIDFVDVESNTTPRNYRGVFRIISNNE